MLGLMPESLQAVILEACLFAEGAVVDFGSVGVALKRALRVGALAGVDTLADGEIRVLDEVVHQDQLETVHEDGDDEDHHEDLELLGELVEPLEENVAGDPEQRLLEPVHDKEQDAFREHERREVDRQLLQVRLELRLVGVRAVLARLDVGELEPLTAHLVNHTEHAVQDVDADGAVENDVEEVPVARVVVHGVVAAVAAVETADAVHSTLGLDDR